MNDKDKRDTPIPTGTVTFVDLRWGQRLSDGAVIDAMVAALTAPSDIERQLKLQLEPQKLAFTSCWSFWASLFLNSHQAEDVINHLQEVYEHDVKRYGEKRARFLYRKNVLVSLWPVAKWVCHRVVAVGILKHYFPAIETITRLFR